MPTICDRECPEEQGCPYEVCPFVHEYTERDEVVSGYRYIADPQEEASNESSA